MRTSFAERAAIVTLLGQTFGVVGTVFAVEASSVDDRAEAGERYARLAGTVWTASVLAAVWLALDELDDRRDSRHSIGAPAE